MKDFESKMAELKKLEEETFAEAKADAAAIVAEVRGKNPSTFVVAKFSDMEDSDWSAERYVPEAQARALESVLDRPTTAGIVSAVKGVLSEKCVRRSMPGYRWNTINHKVSLSRRTMGIVEKSSIGKYAASVAKQDIARPSEGRVPGSSPGGGTSEAAADGSV